MSEQTENMDKNEGTEQEQTEANEALREHIAEQSLKIVKRLPAMGPVVMLYLQSAHRRFQFIADLEWLLLPPLVSGQCKLYMKKEYPVSYVSWAFLNEEAEGHLLRNGGKLRPDDWKSGDRLWIIDMVAPFGGIENMLKDIRQNEFPDKEIRMVAPDVKTGGITARRLRSYNSEQEEKAANAATPQPEHKEIH